MNLPIASPFNNINNLISYLINGLRFNVKDRDMYLKSQNSGVLVRGDENTGQSTTTENPMMPMEVIDDDDEESNDASIDVTDDEENNFIDEDDSDDN
ncbi:hypothetical protein VNO80_19014 [Phaseolus coccineus]|uniref:Uncharacterized protein n=1 Tax=Phaseolus coccineus TaxID=3886 RepID=A0AAN9MFA7_PHACN